MKSVLEFLKKNMVILLLVIMVIIFSITTTGFATMKNMFNILRQCSIMGIVAAGMAVVIISGGIDLSVGTNLSLCTVLCAWLITKQSAPPVVACVIGILVTTGVGCLNGLFITATNMPPFIATLAMMKVLEGVSFTITGGMPIYGLPDGMKFIGQGYLGPIPIPVLFLAAVFALAHFVMAKTYLGRYIYAVGSSEEVARLSGLGTRRIKILAYVISGFFVGLAGVICTARIGAGQANAGTGMEMDVITAVVVGGVAMEGGKGKVTQVIIGTLVMGVISNGLGIMGVNTYGQMICKGVILLVVVGINCFRMLYANEAREA